MARSEETKVSSACSSNSSNVVTRYLIFARFLSPFSPFFHPRSVYHIIVITLLVAYYRDRNICLRAYIHRHFCSYRAFEAIDNYEFYDKYIYVSIHTTRSQETNFFVVMRDLSDVNLNGMTLSVMNLRMSIF